MSASLRDQLLGSADLARFAGCRVGVVFGGQSAERDISLRTGSALAKALRQSGQVLVEEYDFPSDQARFLHDPPAVVLNGLHGGAGEDGTLQGFLQLLGIPFTGSGVLASALTMDKSRAKAVMHAAGIPVPRGVLLGPKDLTPQAFCAACSPLQGPLVVKPNDGGSSVGTFLVGAGEPLSQEAQATLLDLLERGVNDAVLVEERLEGPEYSVGFFDTFCLGAIEIEPTGEPFYDYKAKYQSQSTRYLVVEAAPRLDALRALASAAWRAVGGAGVGRVDVMAGQGGRLHVLEVNTVPGMTATSLVPKLAASHGIDFGEFVSMMVALASTRPGYRTQQEASA